MRKIYSISSVVLAFAVLVACAKHESDGTSDKPAAVESVVFTASFERHVSEAKTTMGGVDNHQIFWNEGDAIKVWDNAGRSGIYIASQSGTDSYFKEVTSEKGFAPESAIYAFYPAGTVQSIDNGIIKFSIPETQTYMENSFGYDANFAVSQVKDETTEEGKDRKILYFTNVAGLLRIQLTCSSNTNQVYVSKIVLKDMSQNICGTFSVDAKDKTPAATYLEKGGRTITLNCATPVALSSDIDNPTSFYITVPVGSFAENSGFEAEVYNNYNHLVTVLKSSNKNGKATISRAHITKMSNKNCSWLPTNCAEGLYLQSHLEEFYEDFYESSRISAGANYESYDRSDEEGDHGQIINTGVDPSMDGGLRIRMKARFDNLHSTGDAPVICGLCSGLDVSKPTPCVLLDYHKDIRRVRARFGSNSIVPATELGGNNDVIDCDVCFSSNLFTANFNGSEYSGSVTGGQIPGGTSFFLFGKGYGADPGWVGNQSNCSIYSCVMFRPNGKMIRNFIPVTCNNVNGMWDMVEGKFYGPEHTEYTAGNFIIGEGPDRKDPTLYFERFRIDGGVVLDINNKSIAVQMPYGTDLTKLTASYRTNASSVWIGSEEQISGENVNNFSQPVIYRLKEGFKYNDLTVNVASAEKGGTDATLRFTSFTVPGGEMVGMKGNELYVAVKDGVNLCSLVPTFTTNANKVCVGTTEQMSGVTANDFSKEVLYRLESENCTNEIIVKVFQFSLPSLFVTSLTNISTITKNEWTGGTALVLFDNETGTADILGADDGDDDIAVNEIKGRGHNTWLRPKKPYTIKLAQKESLLGMPKDKRWNLLANWMDRTDMRNDVALQLARVSSGLDWTPRGKFIELVYNGVHRGNYYLCEHIKIANNRVNITEYEDGQSDPQAKKIGYLLEFDTSYDETNKFRSSLLDLPINVKSPDAEGFDISYISNWINSLESKLVSSETASTNYKDLLDIDSYIDWFLVHEMTANAEPNWPKSSYMYKDSESAKDNKIHAGPCWDFDWGTFKPESTGAWAIKNAIWYQYLFKDPEFVARLKEKWAAQKPYYDGVAAIYIDAKASAIRASVALDKNLWPCTETVNGDEQLDFDSAVARLKQSLQSKIAFMDKAIKEMK